MGWLLQQLGMAVCLLFCVSKFMVHTVVPGGDGTNGYAEEQTETSGGRSEKRQLKSADILDPSDVHSALPCDRGTCENRCFEPYGHRDVPDNFQDTDDKDLLVTTPATSPFTPPHIVTQTKISVDNPCHCDELCIIFGDCCYDFFLLCHNTSISTLVSNISDPGDVSSVVTHFVKDHSFLDLKMSMFVSKKCENSGNNWYWMISSCPHTSTDHVAANKCKHVSNSSNPLSQIPASHKHFPVVVFHNVYCGLCNGIKKEKLLLWNSAAACSDSVVPADYVDLIRKLGSGKCTMKSSPPSGPGPRKCLNFHFQEFSSRNEHSTDFLLSQLYEYWVFIGNTVYKNPHLVLHLNMVVDNMSCSPTFDYHGAEMPFCPDSSCKGLCNQSNYFDPSHCQCTIDCVLYGDCCYDFLPICLNKTMSLMSLLQNVTLLAKELEVTFKIAFIENVEANNATAAIKSGIEIYAALRMTFLQYKTCVKITDTFYRRLWTWMIGKCPNKFPNVEAVSLCEQPSFSILDSLIPVSHKMHSDITYRNKYCGLCHNQSVDDLVQWRANMMCPFNKPNLDLNALLLEGKCKIIFEINKPHRYCKESDEILSDSFMNKDELNNSIELQNLTNNVSWCHLYRYEVMAGNKHFRNPHCTDIKGLNVSCFPPMGGRGGFGESQSDSGGLSILFNFNEHGFSFETDRGKLVSPQRSCGSDEVYDYIYSKCTKLKCLRGTIAINGRCVSNGTSFAEKIHQLLPNGFPYFFASLYINLPEETKRIDITDKFNLFIDAEEVRPFKNFLSIVDFDVMNSTMNETEDFGNPINRLIKIVFKNNGSITAHLNAFSYMNELVNEHIFGNLSQRSNIFVSNYDDLFNMSCVYGAKRTLNNVTLGTLDNTIYANESDRLYPLGKVPFTLTYQDKTTVLENIVVCDIPLNCDDPVTYNQSDFYEEGTTLKNRDRYKDIVLHNDNYFIQNNTVYSCHNFTQSYSVFFTFDNIQSILSNVVSGISITSLAITLFVYTLLPELRNLPGRLIMSLSASILLAQVLLLLIHLPTGILCQALAIALHFFWLTSFMWMTIISINLAHTFSGRAKSESSCTIAKTHAKFAFCAVGLPLMLVTASVVVDFMEIRDLVIGYGAFGICWIANPHAFLLVFGVPLAEILFVNIISFILTFHNIEKSMRISKDISSTKKEKGKFFIYGKIFIIMGLSWSSSFVAAYADISFIWYIFIILNNLQGFYIFVSFICTDRVYRLLKKKVRGPDSDAYTKSTIHTVTTKPE